MGFVDDISVRCFYLFFFPEKLKKYKHLLISFETYKLEVTKRKVINIKVKVIFLKKKKKSED